MVQIATRIRYLFHTYACRVRSFLDADSRMAALRSDASEAIWVRRQRGR
jgi:hypothetical protein